MSDELKAGKVVRIGDSVTLILGDCRAHLPIKVAAVITDPPYDEFTHAGAFTESARKHVNGTAAAGIAFAALDTCEIAKVLLECSSGWVVAFCALEMLGKYQSAALDNYIRGGIWDRITNTPQISGDRPGQGGEGVAIMNARKGRMKWNGGGKAAIWRYMVERGMKEHPTQKPVDLMAQLVSQFSDAGDVVLDPFMGGGSTGIACIRTGRRFIGIELDPVHFATAEQRIRRELEAGTFDFSAQPASASQQPLL
jgi:site-specific DNA-methyltransferase (adenine-specific)